MRIFIFNSFNIPKNYIEIFHSMSKIYRIYILLTTKTIYNNKNIQINSKNSNNLFFYGKKYTLNHINYLSSINHKKINLYTKTKKNNLLQIIQNKILRYKNNYEKKIKKKSIYNLLYSTDHSISIHVCNSLQQEIEILHSNLLNIFKNNQMIVPKDILVLSVNINIYTPFIYSIFNSKSKNYFIPFTISNLCISENNIIFNTFNKLLNILDSEFKNEEILSLLSLPILLEKFKINLEELQIIKKLINHANIKLGIDKKHLNKLLKINTEYNSWDFGIKRMLLNYSINKKNIIWNNSITLDEINQENYKLIEILQEFIILLNKWRKIFLIPKYLKNWKPLLSEIITDFFPMHYLNHQDIIILKNTWNKIIYNGVLSKFKKKVTIKILQSILINKLNNKKYYSNLFSGTVNFCNIDLLENIPFKIIYLIGINEDKYPRNINLESFNLIKNYKQTEQISHRMYDSHIFLNCLLNTEKYFFISYIKKQFNKIEHCSSSIFIEQLVKNIIETFLFINKKNQKNQTKEKNTNNKTKIINHLYNIYDISNVSNKINTKTKIFKSFNNQFIKINENKIKKITFLDKKKLTTKSNKIDIVKLIQFWKNPIFFLLNKILKINIPIMKKEENSQEYFYIDQKNIYDIKSKILDYLIYKKDTNEIYTFYNKSGILPYGNFGKYIWNTIKQEMIELSKIIFKFQLNSKEKKINININQFQLYNYQLKEINKIGLIRWTPNKIRIQDKMTLWIEHLIYCFLEGDGNSYMFGNKKNNCIYSNLSSCKASYYLEQYIKGYLKGIETPLLFTQSGIEWIQCKYDKKNKKIINTELNNQISKKKFFNKWNGNKTILGEKDNFYIKKIIPEINQNEFINLCNIAKKWFFPILENQL